jgi:hypothetical protein
MVIHPVPPWPDPQAPQRHFWLRPDLWSRMFVFSQDDNPIPWAPGVFASLAASHPDVARARGGFYVYHTHYEPDLAGALDPRPNCKPEFLWCFAGSSATWPQVREPLLALNDERGLTIDTADWNRHHRWQFEGPGRSARSDALQSYASKLHQAKFIVCPRGAGLSSVRLFEAMRAGKCPVIVSDGWLAPPFVDWESCAVRIPESDLHHLPELLREREQDAAVLGACARRTWEQRYAPAAMLLTLAEACIDIAPDQRRFRTRLRMMRRSATNRATARKAKLGVRRVVAAVRS